jgi:hypothetical protein
MKWFDRWFVRKSKWAWENRDAADTPEVGGIKMTRISGQNFIEEDGSPWQDGLRINIKKVIGGFIVSFRTYDRIRDRSDERHYIITDEQNFNTELGKIITLESMKQT